MKSLKNLGWFLVIAVVVVVAIFISDRLFTVVRTMNSNEPMNQELLPDTYRETMRREANAKENIRLKVEANRMELLKEEPNRLWKKVGDTKKLIQQLQKQSQPPQLQEVLVLGGDTDELLSKVDEMKELSHQFQKQSKFQQLQKMSELENKLSSLWGELSEIQARIEKLEKESSTPSAP